MRHHARGSTTLLAIILLAGVVFAAANLGVLLVTVKGTIEVPPLVEYYNLCPPCVAYFVAGPLIVSVLVAVMVYRLTRSTPPAPQLDAAAPSSQPAAPSAPPPPPSPAPAVRLLALLQQEGRLVDFLQEDIGDYSDAQVGAAVRAVHAGCRKVLAERVQLDRVYTVEEGTPVSVEPGFDPSVIRLEGNVVGEPPFHGTLQHAGWRATHVSLPEAAAGSDPTVIAPAEVQLT